MKAICSLGDNISDGSEKLLQGAGKVRIYAILVKVHAINHIFLQKIPGSHKEQSSP